jgi:hypothetical protein
MRQRLRSHLTYANIISTVALFLVLGGGTAVALNGSNTVFTDDIVDNDVYSADVRNDTLTGGGLTAADLRAASVGTSEVVGNSLTGGDINESSLGIVPNANQLDGKDSSEFFSATGGSIFGNVSIGGTLTLSNYLQLPYAISGSAPASADCDEGAELGRVVIRTDGTTNLYLCTGTGGWIGK